MCAPIEWLTANLAVSHSMGAHMQNSKLETIVCTAALSNHERRDLRRLSCSTFSSGVEYLDRYEYICEELRLFPLPRFQSPRIHTIHPQVRRGQDRRRWSSLKPADLLQHGTSWTIEQSKPLVSRSRRVCLPALLGGFGAFKSLAILFYSIAKRSEQVLAVNHSQ